MIAADNKVVTVIASRTLPRRPAQAVNGATVSKRSTSGIASNTPISAGDAPVAFSHKGISAKKP